MLGPLWNSILPRLDLYVVGAGALARTTPFGRATTQTMTRCILFPMTMVALTTLQDPFDDRECLFQDKDGHVTMPALANLDTGLKVPAAS